MKEAPVKSCLVLVIFLVSGCAASRPDVRARAASAAHYSMAALYESRGEIDKAIVEYETALAYDRTAPEIHAALLGVYYGQGRFDKAIVYGESALGFGDSSLKTLTLLGEAYVRINRPKRGAKLLEMATERDSTDASLWRLLATVHEMLGKKSLAENEYKIAVELEPHSPLFLGDLGGFYGKTGRFEQAGEQYRKALAIDSTFLDGYIGLGVVKEHLNDYEGAARMYEKALGLDPSNGALKSRLGDIKLRLEHFDDAERLLGEAVSMNPLDARSHRNLGSVYYHRKKYDRSIEQFLMALGLDPRDALSHYYLSRAYVGKGMVVRALSEMEIVLSLDPEFPGAQTYKAYLLVERGDYSGALRVLRSHVRRRRDDKTAHELLGLIYAGIGDDGKAERAYLRALDIDSTDGNIWHSLGLLYDRAEKYESAISSFRNAIKYNPQDASAYNYIGYMYADQGRNLEKAVLLIEKALELEPDNGYFRDSLGWAYYRLGKLDDAAAELEKAVRMVQELVIHEHLGDVYEDMGRFEDARRQYELALELDPENKQIKEKIEALP